MALSFKNQKLNIPIPKSFLAKTVKLDDDSNIAGVSVSTHCKIVGLIAKELISRKSKYLQQLLFPCGTELAASSHDVGKINPEFQPRIYEAINQPLNFDKKELNGLEGNHAAVSQASLENITSKYIPQIVGRHHGKLPETVDNENSEKYGGEEWQNERVKLLEELKLFFNCNWPKIENETQANAISGLVSVADWIGSGSIFDNKECDFKKLINESIDNAGFINFDIRKNLTFKNVFDWKPRKLQRKFYQLANEPGVYILEAPMGSGKTEAALFAAYKALIEHDASGIYFALPTQLTSNKIYERMNKFLEKVLHKKCKFRSLLLHSNSWLQDTDLGKEGIPGKSWFNQSKRGLLSPFAVGTIDQALLGVMNVKHGFVRAFGLAGKVVILDEIHSYDAYTSTIVQNLVTNLRKLGCIVIILSATLTAKKREELIEQKSLETGYPLISSSKNNQNTLYFSFNEKRFTEVLISIKNDDEIAIQEALKRASSGQQVLWIENTVSDAQDKFKQIFSLSKQLNIECGLLHSRFTKNDRKINEDKWVSLFGKEGVEKRKNIGRILIGTQVLEQSLDIDADFLITRICPTDMLFQRIGRLWRHEDWSIKDSFRKLNFKNEAWILSPKIEEILSDVNILGKTKLIYFPYIIYRTLKVWNNKTHINLPLDIRTMIEETYEEKIENDVTNKWKNEVINQKDLLTNKAKITFCGLYKTLSDDLLTTRYSEKEENAEVLLVKKIIEKDSQIILNLLNDEVFYIDKKCKSLKTKKQIAIKIQENIVSVPNYSAPQTLLDKVSWLKDYIYIGDKKNNEYSKICLGIVKNNIVYDINDNIIKKGYFVSYCSTNGYSVSKINGTN
jgi:CRISPR-associated endonuclease/helicase Cas3